ncbi:exodeoxyribonuclease VII large subunit [Moraxella pluranimalium]|uniref:Exodeoxyribonuclease 7 large subunit n=1 Tax=Moraxella pluranimalium TaxID=470453 RepID=A0A1T0CQF2_9GAMM|nr:exodeoxyribonuclease VII large subunit [Moraxella pluranimalium]OOS24588.1 exodeoxyribonuclease VII large subunit [Moraxella pluranimalium]
MPKSIVEQALRLGASLPSSDDITAKHRQIAAEFEADMATDAPKALLSDTHLSLSDYLTAVKLVIDDSFDHEVWVRAEIRLMNTKGGHYYFELAEKDDAGDITASCRATLWRFRASTVLAKFKAATGQTLSAGSSVLIKCSATFHAQYGFSLNISDIDPSYTLGEIAMAYQAMKKRLSDEGLLMLNRKLPTPFDIRQVVVIAPEQAAGLGDFRAEADRLASANACQFHYHYATFQGNHAPSEIRAAIMTGMSHFIESFDDLPDLLVIIRGGGAVGDLAYLNDYELAALVAECPVPVWVGVGHERDTVILDEVAHTSFDTPSKVILGIESHLVAMVKKAQEQMTKINRYSQTSIAHAKQNSERSLERIRLNSSRTLMLAKKDSHHELRQLQSAIKHQAQRQKQHNDALISSIKSSATKKLATAKALSQTAFERHQSLGTRLHQLKENCRHLQSLILIQHPKRTLQKGYAIISDETHTPIGSITKLHPNQTVHISFADGKASAKIEHIDPSDLK